MNNTFLIDTRHVQYGVSFTTVLSFFVTLINTLVLTSFFCHIYENS